MNQIKFEANEIPQAFEFSAEQAYWKGYLAGAKATAEHALHLAHQKIMNSRPEPPKPEPPQPETPPSDR